MSSTKNTLASHAQDFVFYSLIVMKNTQDEEIDSTIIEP